MSALERTHLEKMIVLWERMISVYRTRLEQLEKSPRTKGDLELIAMTKLRIAEIEAQLSEFRKILS
jgi:hypothetical protein